MAYSTDDRELERFFGECGEVKDAKVILDRNTNKSRGFGFVTFADTNGPIEARKRSGQELGGRELRIEYAR